MKQTIIKLMVGIFAMVTMNGCSTLGTKEGFTACKAADVVTTVTALKAGAVESNPLMAGVIKSLGMAGFVGLSVGLIYMMWTHEEEIPKSGTAIASGISCGAAISNAGLLI